VVKLTEGNFSDEALLEIDLAQELASFLCDLGVRAVSQGSCVYKKISLFRKDKCIALSVLKRRDNYQVVLMLYNDFYFTEAYKEYLHFYAEKYLKLKIISLRIIRK
jgi:hypothetical protein